MVLLTGDIHQTVCHRGTLSTIHRAQYFIVIIIMIAPGIFRFLGRLLCSNIGLLSTLYFLLGL